MQPIVLFRPNFETADERDVAARHLRVETQRVDCRDALVVGRYSVLPYYDELEYDLRSMGSRLANTPDQHRWIANNDYAGVLAEFLPRSWEQEAFVRSDYPGPFVVKGRTNSRKHKWNTHMFAANRAEAVLVADRLRDDPLIGPQGLIYREYVPLRTFEVGLNGLPFTNEWRCFFWRTTLLAAGYYWSEAADVATPAFAPAGRALARAVAAVAAEHCPFFVVDVAERATGGWIAIELNDGQMSGLSCCDPDELYRNLAVALAAEC